MTIVLAALVLTAAAQAGALFALGRRRPVGDEVEYLARARSQDPFGPDPFLRPPGMTLLARCLRSEARLRAGMALLGWLTAAAVAATAWHLHGGAAAVVAVLLLLLPERLIYACHIWPDTLLALVLAGVVMVLTQPASSDPVQAALLGVLAATGCLIRVDFLPVAPLAGVALAASADGLEGALWWALLTPTLAALAGWAWRNRRRYGRFVFDDTWAFNVMVAGELRAAPPGGDSGIEPAILRVSERWAGLQRPRRAQTALAILRSLLSSPVRALAQAGRRALAYLGPDTFVSQKLLLLDGAYPDLSPTAARRARPLLRLGFPLLVTLCTLGSLLLGEPPPPHVWPVAGVAAAGFLVHTRTRYRVVVMPALALWAADLGGRSVALLAARPIGWSVLALALGLALLTLLGRIEFGREVPRA